ncbi:relaxase/mobilization nuclease domain-containing protein [Echinicola marina]|uniref:relaxase/mobilization nuclease domain-containing protein n=1 Tax=Echinicola marina TaxID=2859768 RepID=UPI001CF63132|nr:relaxase/mobilization nuclease domain-containing protein [Echinicola marina]UCS92505.1 relaxase/mobilization nuclease domain-containing protein [Echinicola marina]
MIAKQSIGKSFMGAFEYNFQKLHDKDITKRAELLATNFSSTERAMVKKELDIMKSLNPRLTRNTYHTSLNFGKEESLTNDKMLAIAEEYMRKMGFDNNAYFIFRHHDTEHPHCHILALRNRFDGRVVSDSNNFRRSEKLIRELEKKYGLQEVKSSQEATLKAANKDEIEMVLRTGEPSKRMMLQEKVNEALKQANNIPSFIEHLEKEGINVLFNQASTGRVSGISYLFDGFTAKGQALGNQFKWGNVSKKLNYEQTRDSKEISKANEQTRAKYPSGASKGQDRISGTDKVLGGTSAKPSADHKESEGFVQSDQQHSLTTAETRSQDGSAYQGTDWAKGIPFSDDTGRENSLFSAYGAIAGLSQLLGPVPATGNLEEAPQRKRKKKKKKSYGRGI